MKYIFINLKRFDVPKKYGGLCPDEKPSKWIRDIIEASFTYKLHAISDTEIIYMLPEALLDSANTVLENKGEEIGSLKIGSQSVYRSDVEPGKNFGAFTSLLPAAAAKSYGSKWTIIGHSEERKDKMDIMKTYDKSIEANAENYELATNSVNTLISQEIRCALLQQLNVLLCVGETIEEKGDGTFQDQQERVKQVLKKQLKKCLESNMDLVKEQKIVIGYEPIWAIGPGKTPPNEEYISFVSDFIKTTSKELFGNTLPVVYGGGLKEANAEMISNIQTIDGGLVALTKFTDPIGFEVKGLKTIIEKYK